MIDDTVYVHITDLPLRVVLKKNNFKRGDVLYTKRGDLIELWACGNGNDAMRGNFATVQEAIAKCPFILSPDAKIVYV